MKKVLLCIVFVLAALSSARAEMFDVANIPEMEKISLKFAYRGIDLRKPPDKPFVLRFQVAQAASRADYITRIVGEGPTRHVEAEIRAVSQNGYTSSQIFRFKPGPKLMLEYTERNVFQPSGRKILTESYDLRDSNPPLPNDLSHPYTFPLILRGLEFKPGLERNFHVWFNPTLVFAVKLIVKGTESVTVAAGTFNCHRVEIGPDLIDLSGPVLGRALKPLIAPYVAWLDVKPPHRIVKYQGPFGMVNIAGPVETYELAKVGD